MRVGPTADGARMSGGRPAAPARVLAVDDEPGCLELVRAGLEAAGLSCECCRTAREAKAALARERFDLVLLDYALGDGDGLELCRFIRRLPGGKRVVVALLSHDRRLCDGEEWLHAEADTCWRKQTDMGRLAALVRGLLRRRPAGEPGDVTLAPGVRLLRAIRVVRWDMYFSGVLSEREVRFLEMLAAARDKAPEGLVDRETVRPALGIDELRGDLTLNTVVRRLRWKLGGGLAEMVETVQGKGWRIRPGYPPAV